MTFSLVARCVETGMFGMAVASSSPAVAARCANARAGIGAVSSQNVTDPTLGPKTLDLMERGFDAASAVAEIKKTENFMDYRQVLAVDGNGLTVIHSGKNSLGIWAEAKEKNVASGGNLLANEEVPKIILEGFLTSEGHLGDRLLVAMRAGLSAGGEAGPIHSAGMKIVDRVPWPVADLRCDWTDGCPITALEITWQVYKPQLDAYIQRALNPTKAPSYSVPGDE